MLSQGSWQNNAVDFFNKAEPQRYVSSVHFKRVILVGDALILMMPSNQSILKKHLFGSCVQFSALKGDSDFVEGKIKFGV